MCGRGLFIQEKRACLVHRALGLIPSAKQVNRSSEMQACLLEIKMPHQKWPFDKWSCAFCCCCLFFVDCFFVSSLSTDLGSNYIYSQDLCMYSSLTDFRGKSWKATDSMTSS